MLKDTKSDHGRQALRFLNSSCHGSIKISVDGSDLDDLYDYSEVPNQRLAHIRAEAFNRRRQAWCDAGREVISEIVGRSLTESGDIKSGAVEGECIRIASTVVRGHLMRVCGDIGAIRILSSPKFPGLL
jgi:hypothetical protein